MSVLIVSLRLRGSLRGHLGGDALVALLGDGQAHALAARQRDVRLRALADYEHVVQPAQTHTGQRATYAPPVYTNARP